jgi:ribosome-binding protein aMBF1 (putative translation factor)
MAEPIRFREPLRYDYPEIIRRLTDEAHISVHTIAKMIHVQRNQVKRWREGAEPRKWQGDMLIAIFEFYCEGGTPVSRPAPQGEQSGV